MYQQHFQLKTQPFREHAAATALWVDSRMQEGLARLDYLVASATLGLVTGPSGAGKSALLKRFMHELSRQQCESVYCHLTHLKSTGLLKLVVSQLGEVPRRGKERLFEQILSRAGRTECTLLLIIDEAHLLEGETLTDLRLLVSSAIDTAPPLKILLVGQETLRATLKQAQHYALLNRIGVHYRVKPLTKEQTGRYIDIQMTQAGGAEDIFDISVKELIHDFTGGLPRAINNLATACLLQAVARNVLRIDDALFQQTSAEFQLG
jgi:general secretion pathway protein A